MEGIDYISAHDQVSIHSLHSWKTEDGRKGGFRKGCYGIENIERRLDYHDDIPCSQTTVI